MILSGQVSSPAGGGIETVTLTINLDGYTSPQYAYIKYINPTTMEIIGDTTESKQYTFPLTITTLKNSMIHFLPDGWSGIPRYRIPLDNNLKASNRQNTFFFSLSDSASVTLYKDD